MSTRPSTRALIVERLKGDLANYFLELKLFLIEHVKTERELKMGAAGD